jgi:hypothetical protein
MEGVLQSDWSTEVTRALEVVCFVRMRMTADNVFQPWRQASSHRQQRSLL